MVRVISILECHISAVSRGTFYVPHQKRSMQCDDQSLLDLCCSDDCYHTHLPQQQKNYLPQLTARCQHGSVATPPGVMHSAAAVMFTAASCHAVGMCTGTASLLMLDHSYPAVGSSVIPVQARTNARRSWYDITLLTKGPHIAPPDLHLKRNLDQNLRYGLST